ncbi:MAG: hypothetical protein ACFFD4_19810 [Candidatus Odinarchaeota archaeon]
MDKNDYRTNALVSDHIDNPDSFGDADVEWKHIIISLKRKRVIWKNEIKTIETIKTSLKHIREKLDEKPDHDSWTSDELIADLLYAVNSVVTLQCDSSSELLRSYAIVFSDEIPEKSKLHSLLEGIFGYLDAEINCRVMKLHSTENQNVSPVAQMIHQSNEKATGLADEVNGARLILIETNLAIIRGIASCTTIARVNDLAKKWKDDFSNYREKYGSTDGYTTDDDYNERIQKVRTLLKNWGLFDLLLDLDTRLSIVFDFEEANNYLLDAAKQKILFLSHY